MGADVQSNVTRYSILLSTNLFRARFVIDKK